MTFPLYINKEFQECFDSLRVKTSIDGTKISTSICKAIQRYMVYLDNRKDILLDKEDWQTELDKLSPQKLKNLDTLISQLHSTILDTYGKRNIR